MTETLPTPAAPPRYVARTGFLSITTWDWHAALCQAAHRLGSLAWILALAGAFWKKLPQEMVLAAAVVSGIGATVAGLLALLVVRDPTHTRWKEALGATIFSALALLAAAAIVAKNKFDAWPYVRQWLRLSFEPALVMYVARGLVAAFVLWLVAAFAYARVRRDA